LIISVLSLTSCGPGQPGPQTGTRQYLPLVLPKQSGNATADVTESLETVVPSEGVIPTKAPPKIITPEATMESIIAPDNEAIIADLARRLNTSVDEIQVVEDVQDEFPAGDLGCPQPEVTPRPIPAIVTGRRVVLEFDGQTYEYHVHGQQAAYCGVR
jgi:hypothetical protein